MWIASTGLWVWWEYYAVDGYREYILGDAGPTQVTAGVGDGDDGYDYDEYSRKIKRHDGKHEEFYANYTGDYSITYKWAMGVFTTALALSFIGL